MINLDVSNQLGKRIEYLRKQKHWSQEMLGFESEVNKNYISDLEHGRRNPTLKVLMSIANALGVSLELLFKGID